MQKMKQKFYAAAMILCMLLQFMPIGVFAENTFSGGDGTEQSPFQISTVEDLKQLSEDVSGGSTYADTYFELTENLNLAGTNWTPIGNSIVAFQGIFNGGFHTIYNLTVDTSSQYCGLFGKLENAEIKNLGIENANIASSANDVAVLAGNAQGGTISYCYVTGTVKGQGALSGILGSTHSSSYTTRISNCYARVAIVQNGTYTKDLAGISGRNEATSVEIENCYSACTGEIRPIAGWDDGSAVTSSQFVNTYFDKTLSPDFSADAGRIDLGKTSDELKMQATFDGWDFTSTWAIDPTLNGGYPYLLGFTPGIGGAPGSVTVTVTDENDQPVTDAAVFILPNGSADDSQKVALNHEGNGIYSGMVTTSDESYDVYVNGTKIEGISITQNGTLAAEADVKTSIVKTTMPTYEKSDYDSYIYANGTPIILVQGSGDAKNTVIYIDNDGDGTVSSGDTIWAPDGMDTTEAGNDLRAGSCHVYGGTKDDAFTGDTSVTMLSGQVASIFGGSQNGEVNGNTNVKITGGTLSASVYGGGRSASSTVTGSTNVTVTGGSVNWVYGGGFDGSVSTDTNVLVGGDAVVSNYIFGGSNGTVNGTTGSIGGNTSVTLADNASCHAVYGGSYFSGEVAGNASVTITGGTVREEYVGYDNVYGGGNSANVNGDVSVNITGGTIEGFVYMYNIRSAVGGNKTLTVGGTANIVKGIAINSTNGVNSFAIKPNLEESASVAVYLPFNFQVDSIIATDATEGDADKIVLKGTVPSGASAYLDGTDIKVGTPSDPAVEAGNRLWRSACCGHRRL